MKDKQNKNKKQKQNNIYEKLMYKQYNQKLNIYTKEKKN